jgi:hypothetical protein
VARKYTGFVMNFPPRVRPDMAAREAREAARLAKLTPEELAAHKARLEAGRAQKAAYHAQRTAYKLSRQKKGKA